MWRPYRPEGTPDVQSLFHIRGRGYTNKSAAPLLRCRPAAWYLRLVQVLSKLCRRLGPGRHKNIGLEHSRGHRPRSPRTHPFPNNRPEKEATGFRSMYWRHWHAGKIRQDGNGANLGGRVPWM
jgi:hypothetical protein